MNTLTNSQRSYQTILNHVGKPAFVVIPYDEFKPRPEIREGFIPNEVVEKRVMEEMTMLQAWREYLLFSRTQIATRMNIDIADYARLETTKRPSKSMRQKAADALGISFEQLVY